MIDYIAQWPLGVAETIALLALLSGLAGFFWRAGQRVERGIERLDDGLRRYAATSDERAEELARRVAALEERVRAQTAQEGTVLATLAALQTQLAALSGRLDRLIAAMLKRPD